MKPIRSCLIASALLYGAGIQAAADTLDLRAPLRSELHHAAIGARLRLEGFPDGRGARTTIDLRRVDVYAPNARLIALGTDGERAVPRSPRIEWTGYDASGTTRVQLGFDAGLRNLSGSGSSPAGAFAIRAGDDGRSLQVMPAEDALAPGVRPQVIPGEDAIAGVVPLPQLPSLAGGSPPPAGTLRVANVAIDVDHELLANRFGGTGASNVNAAAAWIADLFASMNVMYERDLAVTLQQGTTIFRTGATPYVIVQDMGASDADLNNFGTYWQNNHDAVQRDFVVLLSGRLTGGFSASGRAWLNAYCRKPSNGGSYSVNKVFTNSGVPVDLSARIVGHELGHNFGAAHTHCTNATSGAFPTATNTIDVCYRGEAGSSCYGGAVSCPVAGPGHPLGTLMSYCNASGSNGANCGQNVLQFHPTQIAALSTLIAANTPSCLSTDTDTIFRDGFD